MAYVVPIHRPSSIRHALRIKLFSADEECLAVAKSNRVEIWRFTDDGNELVLAHAQRVYGTISMLQALRPKDDTSTELLFVGTDRFDFFTLAWDAAQQRLQTVDHFYDHGEKHLRDSQSQDRCVVDPRGRFMALLLWEGVLCVLRMKNRPKNTARNTAGGDCLDWMDQVRLSEMFIKACTFLYSETGHPKIALLYQSQSDRSETRLASYRLTSDDANATVSRFDPRRDREMNEDLKDIGAALLIPVEADESERRYNVRGSSSTANNYGNAVTSEAEPHLGGLLVVGETRLVYYDGVTHCRIEKVPSTPAVYVAWARFDRTHYLVADDQGTLRLLTLLTSGPLVKRLEIHPIGKTSRASALVYYPARSLLFVGSHTGDAQLFRISLSGELAPSSEGTSSAFCQLLQTFTNVGPILDFAVVDMGSLDTDNGIANEYASGQARIVTGSGAYRDASLRSIRSGVGLEDAGILGDFANVRNLFSLRLNNTAKTTTPAGKVDTLVVSFLTETRVFAFDADGGIEEADSLLGGSLDQPSLWVGNVGGGAQNLVLRVTPTGVTLVDVDGSVTVATWTPPAGKTIISASANDRWVLLSVDGTLLVSLSLDGKDLLAVAAQTDFAGKDQIACIHAAPQLPDIGVVSMWAAGTVTIVSLATLQPAGTSVPFRSKNDTTSVARSLALAQVMPPHVAGPTLFVALDEGTVVMFAYNAADSTLSFPKSTILGVHHANLHLLPGDSGMYSILATANHPSLIYGSEGRIICAAVTAQDTTCVCPFDAAAFPGAVVLASPTEIKLAHVDTMRRTHVQTIPMGDSVRRLAYAPAERVFALGCIGLDVVRGVEVPRCAIKLVDDVLFQPVGKPLLLDDGGGNKEEFLESVICTELPDAQGTPTERFLVGTSYSISSSDAATTGAAGSFGHVPDDTTTMGRLLVVGVDSERNPYIVSAHRLRGPCRSLAVLSPEDTGEKKKKIVLGLTKTVIVADYEEAATGAQSRLRRVASTRASTMVIDLAVRGRYIAIGDMMKSTAVVEYIPAVKAVGSDDEDEEEDDDDATKVREKGKGKASKYRYQKPDMGGSKAAKKQEAQPAQLVPVARNYQANWTTAVAALGGSRGGGGDTDGEKMVTDDDEHTEQTENSPSWLEADAYGNLSVLSYNSHGVTAEDRRRLRVTSEMNLGEMVNRIRRIDVQPTNPDTAMVLPQAFLATTEGAVYLFGTVAPAALDLLLQLQTRLATVVKGLGTTSFASYRGFRNTEREAAEPVRFLDGEMLERFLTLDEAQQQAVAEGLGPSVEDLRGRIAELGRMH